MSTGFGVHIGPQNTTMTELRELWTWLDAAGADWISVWDHLYETPSEGGARPNFEAVALLGALAADTTRARLGCLVLCTTYRNVGLLAKSLVTVDHVSGGRFEPGLGSGWFAEEAEAFGIPFARTGVRIDELAEQVGALRRLFDGERVTMDGDHVQLRDAAVRPGPAGTLPIWIGGRGRKRTLRLAAAAADGWNAAYVTAPDFAELCGVLDDWCETVDRDPDEIERSVNLMFEVSRDDPHTARERVAAQWGGGQRGEQYADACLIGRPDDVMEQIAPYVEAGADLVNIVLRPPWDRELLDAYLTAVVPAMRQEWSGNVGRAG